MDFKTQRPQDRKNADILQQASQARRLLFVNLDMELDPVPRKSYPFYSQAVKQNAPCYTIDLHSAADLISFQKALSEAKTTPFTKWYYKGREIDSEALSLHEPEFCFHKYARRETERRLRDVFFAASQVLDRYPSKLHVVGNPRLITLDLSSKYKEQDPDKKCKRRGYDLRAQTLYLNYSNWFNHCAHSAQEDWTHDFAGYVREYDRFLDPPEQRNHGILLLNEICFPKMTDANRRPTWQTQLRNRFMDKTTHHVLARPRMDRLDFNRLAYPHPEFDKGDIFVTLFWDIINAGQFVVADGAEDLPPAKKNKGFDIEKARRKMTFPETLFPMG